MIIVATKSLPAVDRPNADRWNAVRSCQFNLHVLAVIYNNHLNLEPNFAVHFTLISIFTKPNNIDFLSSG